MTTIKTLTDGRTLATDGTALYIDGAEVGKAQAYPLAQPQGSMVAFAKTNAGNIGLSRADIDIINKTARPQTQERPEHAYRRAEITRKYHAWNREHNEGGEGYNPFAAEYREYQMSTRREPEHKED